MEEKILKYIKDNSLLNKDLLYLVALSGGADSVSLLLVLQNLGYKVEAVHCNFLLRGDESDRDEQFCRNLCQERNVPFHTVHFDTKTFAELHRISIEMAARKLRYDYFEQLRKDIGAADICVAHHQDDNVETVLMNMIRGTGLTGLIGIRPRNGHIVRPLLCVSRQEINYYLYLHQQDYVTDSTNLVNDVTRNKLRLDVIPLLQQINSAAKVNIIGMIDHLAKVEKITKAAIAKDIANVSSTLDDETLSIDIAKLKKCVSPEYVLFAILHPRGFKKSQIGEVATLTGMRSGKLWQSPSHTLVVDRGVLLLAKNKPDVDITMCIPEDGNYVLRDGSKLTVGRSDPKVIDKSPNVATIDADKVKFPLTVRRIKKGDRFTPYGMRGSKLVSDYLTDHKRNYFQRKEQLVLSDANDDILWLVDERPDARFCITKNTINAFIIRYSKT